ncbi:MAG TPA: hypothetical protein VGM30_02495 [Puia sp.]|jgi:hypothetical protein
MALPTVIRLVKSLSSPEKRYFKLHTRQQAGRKEYLDLFSIIDASSTADALAIREEFRKIYSRSSPDNAARYLLKVLTDCLVQTRSEKDTFFMLLQGVMRARVLRERSLEEESYSQLKKIRGLASQSQQHFIEYLTYRDELDHFADSDFRELSDKALIEVQMKAKDILKSLNHIQDHHSLFEILKYRLVHSGRVSSEEDKKRLNDLMLSEMILVANKSKNSFASQKLHLLFQSFFFTDIGDHQSALKTFRSLNGQFEQNLELLNNPPLDYLSALNGILDSLHSLQKYGEMGFYTDKLKQLDQPVYPEYFRFRVRKTIAVYQLSILLGEKRAAEAKEYARSIDSLLRPYGMVDEEKQWELYFYCSLAFFHNKDWKRAHAYIGEVMKNHKARPQSLVYKATRLLNMVIYYEKGDTGYLEYDIRSYKRLFGKQHRILRSEKLLLKFIQLRQDRKRSKLPDLQYRKLLKEMHTIAGDRYEKQLLKYFDLMEWIMDKAK